MRKRLQFRGGRDGEDVKGKERSVIEQSGLMIASNDPNRRVKSQQEEWGRGRVKGEF